MYENQEILKQVRLLCEDIHKLKYALYAAIAAVIILILSGMYIFNFRTNSLDSRVNVIDTRSNNNKTNIRAHNAYHSAEHERRDERDDRRDETKPPQSN